MNRSVSEITKLNEQKANLRSQNTQLTQDMSQGKREHKTLLDTVNRNVGQTDNTGAHQRILACVAPISLESPLNSILSLCI